MFEDDIVTGLCVLCFDVIFWGEGRKEIGMWERHGAGSSLRSVDLRHILLLSIDAFTEEKKNCLWLRIK